MGYKATVRAMDVHAGTVAKVSVRAEGILFIAYISIIGHQAPEAGSPICQPCGFMTEKT